MNKKLFQFYSAAVLLVLALMSHQNITAAVLAQYSFSGDVTDPIEDSITLTTQLDPTNVATVLATRMTQGADGYSIGWRSAQTGTPAGYPYLQIHPGATNVNMNSTAGFTVATGLAAEATNCYFTFTVSGVGTNTLNLTSLTFNAARGGSSTPRGFAVQSSVSGFSSNSTTDLLGPIGIPTARPTYTPYSIALTGPSYQGISNITFRIFAFAPSSASSVEFDDFVLNGTVQGTMVNQVLPHATDIWSGGSTNVWDLTGTLNWKDTNGVARGYTNLDFVIFNDSASNFTVNVPQLVSPASVLVSSVTHDYSLSGTGSIVGDGNLIKTGGGALVLGLTNGYVGGTIVSNGLLRLAVPNALPPVGALTLSNSVLDLNGNNQAVSILSGTGGVITNGGSGTPIFTLAGGNNYAGQFMGPLGISLQGAGLQLQGVNTYSGPTTNSGGNLQIVGNDALGTSVRVFTSGGTLNLAGATVSVPVIFTGGQLNEQGSNVINTISGLVTIADGTPASYELDVNSVPGVSGGAELHFTGGIVGGTNNLRIVDDNSGNSDPGNIYIENLPINLPGGELRGYGWHIAVPGNIVKAIHPYFGRSASLEVDDAFVGAPALIIGNSGTFGKLNLKGHSLTVGSLSSLGTTSADEVTSGATATLTVSNTVPSTYVGIITGFGLGLVKDGPSTLTLGSRTGMNNYFGETSIRQGMLYANAGVLVGASIFGFNNISVSGGATYGGAGLSPGDVNVADGGLLLADGASGAQPMIVVGSLNLGTSPTGLTTNTFNAFNGGKILVTNTLVLNGTNVVNISGPAVGVGTYKLIGYGAESINGAFVLNTLPLGVTAHLQDSGTALELVVDTSSAESDVWVGNVTGAWDLSVAQNWKGSVTGTPRAFADLDAVKFDDSATVFTVNVAANISPSATTISNANNTYTFSGGGSITGSGALTKLGTGTVVIGNTNSYSGLTAINQGTVKIGAVNALPTQGSVSINGGKLDLNSTDQAINLLSGSSGLVTNSGTTASLTLGAANTGSATYGALLSGPMNLVKIGANNSAIITGTNTYTGLTFINSGSLVVNGGGALGASSNVVINAGSLVLSNAVVNVPITASNSSGTLLWAAPGMSNLVTGPVTIADGISFVVDSLAGGSTASELHLAGGVTSGTGTLWLKDNNSGTPDPGFGWLDTKPVDLANGELRGFGWHINVSSNVVGLFHPINGRRISLEVDGAFANAPALSLGNPSFGRLDLKGHDLTVRSITNSNLVLASPDEVTSSIGATGHLVVSNAALNIFSGVFSGNMALTKNGNGTLVLRFPSNAAPHTYSGGTVVSGGRLQVDSIIGTGTNLVNVTAGSLSGSGIVLDAVSVQPLGSISPATPGTIGTLWVSNVLTLAGATIMDVNKNGAVITNDLIGGISNLVYGGVLVVSNQGPTALASGDSIKLFDALTYAGGAFTSISPSTPGAGLAWDVSTLNSNGTLKVVGSLINPTPTNITVSATSSALNLSWPSDHIGWHLLMQTNHLASGLSLNPADWAPVPGAESTNQISLPIDKTQRTEFFRLSYP